MYGSYLVLSILNHASHSMHWWYKWGTQGVPWNHCRLANLPSTLVPSTLPPGNPTTLSGHGPLQKEQQVGARPTLSSLRTSLQMASTRENTIYAILARSVHSITRLRTDETGCGKPRAILWRMCVSLIVLTNHGDSAGRRSDKVERWGKVTNVSEGEFALRSRLANSLWHTVYTVSLTNSSTVFTLQICSATPPLQWNSWNRAFATVLPLSFVWEWWECPACHHIQQCKWCDLTLWLTTDVCI